MFRDKFLKELARANFKYAIQVSYDDPNIC